MFLQPFKWCNIDLLEVCEPFDMTVGDLDGGGNDSDEEYLRNKKVFFIYIFVKMFCLSKLIYDFYFVEINFFLDYSFFLN